MIGLAAEFWRWWVGQLLDLVPGSGRDSGRRSGVVMILEPELSVRPGPPVVRARLEKRGGMELVGRYLLDNAGLEVLRHFADQQDRSLEIHVELPQGAMMEKRIVLPLAAERDLERVLEYEIDRETPFEPDEIYWRSTVEQRDRSHRRLVVRLAIVAKAQLADLFERLAQINLYPTLLIGSGSSGARTLIEVNHGQERPREWLDRAVPAAAWVCAALAVALIAAPFLRQSLALASVERRIATLQPTVSAVERLRHRAQVQRQLIETFAGERKLYRDPLEVLAALTAILPDDTHLSELDLSEGRLVITGLSKAAANLIGLISHSPSLRDAAFSAPVRRIDQSGYEVFSITATERR